MLTPVESSVKRYLECNANRREPLCDYQILNESVLAERRQLADRLSCEE